MLIITTHTGNKIIVFKPKALQVMPRKYFAWKGKLFINGIFDGHHYFKIEEIGTTQVKFNHGEYFSGILSRFILRKLGNETRKNFIKMNEAIKQLAEVKDN